MDAGALAPATVRSSAQRAQQLADVALAVYEAGGKAIHLPLDMNHPLVVVLQSAISYDAKGDLKVDFDCCWWAWHMGFVNLCSFGFNLL